MAAPIDQINWFLNLKQYHPILSLLKGFRNGAVYGVKVRFPHSLVMAFLFKSGSWAEKLKWIAEATYTHSRGLALFCLMYKTLKLVLSAFFTDKSGGHVFWAAFLAGYTVFGKYNKVNEQVNLYLLSRIIYGLAKLAVEKGYIPKPKGDTFPWFAAAVWGVVLWLFEYHTGVLQLSLKSSMTYIFSDSEKWHTLRDFILYNH